MINARPFSSRCTRVSVLILLWSCLGCGSADYELRLAETTRWFEFQERQNLLLAKPWAGPGIGVRVPKVLTPYPNPPPAEIQDEEGNMIANPDFQGDFRQPTFMNVTFPNLVGAWHGEVETRVTEGTTPLPCYLFICSNREIWLEDNPVERATTFHQTVSDAVTSPLEIYLQEDDWDNEKYPRGNGYVVPKNYTFTSKPSEGKFSDHPYAISIYLHQMQDIQVAIVLVAPQNVDPKERFEEAWDLSLQTLEVSGEKPGLQGEAPSGSGTGPAF
ncbi:MAG: hypothetical protein O2955_06955 [Planctomycetota bacterium]|nr:hypothetical protein [Planctomycetota bacterium]MDA1212235.1 hypothetical protein [Planctomycetota bacterium]